jgi:hypothetical protein
MKGTHCIAVVLVLASASLVEAQSVRHVVRSVQATRTEPISPSQRILPPASEPQPFAMPLPTYEYTGELEWPMGGGFGGCIDYRPLWADYCFQSRHALCGAACGRCARCGGRLSSACEAGDCTTKTVCRPKRTSLLGTLSRHAGDDRCECDDCVAPVVPSTPTIEYELNSALPPRPATRDDDHASLRRSTNRLRQPGSFEVIRATHIE